MSTKRERLYYLDNIKVFLTILVILHHTSITYGGAGGWYYYEKTDSIPATILLTIFCAVNQSYFMGFFFLISGFFSHKSLEKKKTSDFAKSKLSRLGVPLLIFFFAGSPLTLYFANGNKLFSYTQSFGVGPLWFILALIIFNFAFVILSRMKPDEESTDKPLPKKLTIAVFLLATGIISFVIRLFISVGVEIFGLQLAYFPPYILLFITGIYASGNRWFDKIKKEDVKFWSVISFLFFLIFLIFMSIEGNPDNFMGGLSYQSFIYSIFDPFISTGIIMLILWSFRIINFKSGIARYTARTSYSVYVIHAPVLVLVSVFFKDITLFPIIKVIVTGSIAVLLSYLLSGVIVRIPVLNKIF